MLESSVVNSNTLNMVILGLLALLFVAVVLRRSLAGIGSLVLIAVAYIVDRGAPFINSWLTKNGGQNMAGLQAVTSLRLAIVIVLSMFVLIVLRHLAGRVPFAVRLVSAAIFAVLLVWYILQALHSSYVALPVSSTESYDKLEQFYPVVLLAALIIAGLELWFVYKGAAKLKTKKPNH